MRCDPRAGRRTGRALPHEQRGVRVTVHRPPYRPASPLRASGAEPAELAQHGRHPWVAHGCLDGAASFATDAMQLFGPAYRDADIIRLEPEAACPASASTRSPARSFSRRPALWRRARMGRRGSSACTSLIMPRRRALPTSQDRSGGTRFGGLFGRHGGGLRGGAQPGAGRAAGRRPSARRARDRGPVSRAPPRGARRPARVLLPPDAAHNRHVVLGAKERGGGAPPRHHPAHGPGHAARRDDALRHMLDARCVRGPAHDQQHVLSQALLGRT